MNELLLAGLKKAVQEAKCPGAVAYVGEQDTELLFEAVGYCEITPEKRLATKSTPYDLASLTKVIATTTAIMLLVEENHIDLDAPVSHYLPIPAFAKITVRQCLQHTTGLSVGRPLYKECTSLNEMLQRYAEDTLSWPPGTRRRYSDVEFMILGKVVELVARESLDAFCQRRIFKPLEMTRTGYTPPPEWRDTCAATELCKWRGRVMRGEVHDENAYAVGGVSGHAGLFSTAEDLARFSRALLQGKILKPATLEMMRQIGQLPFYPWQGLGWKMDPWASGSEGYLPSRSAIGHTGWTGTSIWIDFETKRFAILLANTCHPSRTERDTDSLRSIFHDTIARTLYPHHANTHSGLDRLIKEEFAATSQKRIAVLANHASQDQLGHPILDVLARESTTKIIYVYSPEHGFSIDQEAGAQVASKDQFISLYGDRKAPTKEELQKFECLVIDLQDVGSRYYTYAATMLACLKACCAAQKPVLILDRPNPLGGGVLEGPIATTFGRDVCWGPVPIRHGMTFAEIAQFFKATVPELSNLSLEISELDGWPSTPLFAECSLPWTPPSPNIPTPETALMYSGTCLFEGTNLNEGRGTDTPFLLVGAPWLQATTVINELTAEEIPGCRLEATTYTPKAIPGKSNNPRYRDEVCQGIRIKIEKGPEVRAVTTTIALLRLIYRQHPNDFAWGKTFDLLAGGPGLRLAIESGQSTHEILQTYNADLQAFDQARPKRYAPPKTV